MRETIWNDQRPLPAVTHASTFRLRGEKDRHIATPACVVGLGLQIEDEEPFTGWQNGPGHAVIVNGLGCSLGDALYGLMAYEIAVEKYGITSTRVLMSQVYVNATTLQAHTLHPLIHEVTHMPCVVPASGEFEICFDLTAVPIRETFLTMTMSDCFLAEFGIDPKSIPAERKLPRPPGSWRPEWKPSRALVDFVEGIRSPRILLNPYSRGDLRSMTPTLAEKMAAALRQVGGVVFSDEALQKLIPGLMEYDWLVSRMDGVISVDTSTYHLAAMNHVPSLVFFTTIDPKLRIPYLPQVTAHVIAPPGPFAGLHWATPEALEYFGKAWNDSLIDRAVEWAKDLPRT